MLHRIICSFRAMKKILLVAGFFLCFTAGAQSLKNPLPIDSVTHKVTYQGVVEVPGVSKAELYSRAREWFANTFGSAKAVLEMDDKEAGKLIGNTNGTYLQRFMGSDVATVVWRHVNVQVKDGRFKYVFSDFATGVDKTQAEARPVELAIVPASFDKAGNPKPYMASMFAGIQQTAESQVTSLRAAMTKPVKSDW
jgi:hypothetical protein